MDKNFTNTDKNLNSNDKFNELHSKLKIPYTKSKEDIWDKISEKIDNKEIKPETKTIKLSAVLKFAASFIILIGIASIFRFYSTSFYAPAGKHLSVNLPDGSKVKLNANTEISYYKFWWYIERSTKLEGEAYFEVKKGEKFEVISENGKTEVLGTSFNIYSREKQYNVTCLTGKVKVSSTKSELIIKPNEQAIFTETGNINLKKEINAENFKAWTDNKFIFTAVPLNEVFREIERQYGIKIILQEEFNQHYTGNFKKTASVENVLNLVCKPFGITFTNNNNEFYITKN